MEVLQGYEGTKKEVSLFFFQQMILLLSAEHVLILFPARLKFRKDKFGSSLSGYFKEPAMSRLFYFG